MKKKNASRICLVMIAFTAIAWLSVAKSALDGHGSYEAYLEKAAELERKEIYIDALENYKSALAIENENVDIAIKVAEMYRHLGDDSGFISACNQAIEIDPENALPYLEKANYFLNKRQYSEAIEVALSAKEAIKENEDIDELLKKLDATYIEKYVSFADVSTWHMSEEGGYLGVQSNGKWGMVKKNGSKAINYEYDYIGAYDVQTGVIPCEKDGETYYIDKNGNRKLVGDVPYQYLGSFGDGLAPAKRNNVYGYIDTDFNEQSFQYEEAGAFFNGVAAVKEKGTWKLIDTKFRNVGKQLYDEILLDENGFCSEFGTIIVRQGTEYTLLDLEGKNRSHGGFEDARLPASEDGLIAIKKDGKWGFANMDGEIIILPKYEDAYSFSCGLAPVKIAGDWGYINTEGEVVIEATYEEAGVFSTTGAAPVKENGYWDIIVLCRYDD